MPDNNQRDIIYKAMTDAYAESGKFTIDKAEFNSLLDNNPSYIDKIYKGMSAAYGEDGFKSPGKFTDPIDRFKLGLSKEVKPVNQAPVESTPATVPPSEKPNLSGVGTPTGVKVSTSRKPVDISKHDTWKLHGTDLPKEKVMQEFDQASKDLVEATSAMYDIENGHTKEKTPLGTDRIDFAFDDTGNQNVDNTKDDAYLKNSPEYKDAARKLEMARAKFNDRSKLFNETADNIIQSSFDGNDSEVDKLMDVNYSDMKVANRSKVEQWAKSQLKSAGLEESRDAVEALTNKASAYANSYFIAKDVTKLADEKVKSLTGFTLQEKVKSQQSATLSKGAFIVKSAEGEVNQLKGSLSNQAAMEMRQFEASITPSLEGINQRKESIKPNYEKAISDLKAKISAGEFKSQEEIDAAKSEIDKAMQSEVEMVNSDIDKMVSLQNAYSSKINSKYNKLYTEKASQIDRSTKDRLKAINAELNSTGIDPSFIASYNKAYSEAYSEVSSKMKAKIEAENHKSFYGERLLPDNNFLFSHVNDVLDVATAATKGVTFNFAKYLSTGLGSAIKSYSYILGSNEGVNFGDKLSNTWTLPSAEIEGWRDLLDPEKVTASSGQMIGGMAPMIVAQAALAEATGGSSLMSVGSKFAMQGAVGFAMETIQNAGDMEQEVFLKTGNRAKAIEAANTTINDQYKIWYLYAMEGLPFIDNIKMGISGNGFGATLGRAGLKGTVESLTELPQEFMQGSSELRAKEKAFAHDKDGNPVYPISDTPITKFSNIFENKPYVDSDANTTTPRDRFENTAQNIIPSSFIMGGSHDLVDYGVSSIQSKLGSRFAIKKSLAGVSENFHNQFVFDMMIRKGWNFASSYVTSSYRNGVINKAKYESIINSMESLKPIMERVNAGKLNTIQSKILAALSLEVSEKQAAVNSVTSTDEQQHLAMAIDRTAVTASLEAAQSNLNDFIKGNKAKMALITMDNNEQFIATYDQLDWLLGLNSFTGNAAGNIKIDVSGDGILSSGENLNEKIKSIFNIQDPTQEEGPTEEAPKVNEVNRIFAQTEQPWINSAVSILEERMNNAEPIPVEHVNEVIDGLSDQFELIMNDHGSTDSGVSAAQIILDKIDKLRSYEFTTDKENKITPERATISNARGTVESKTGIVERFEGAGTDKKGNKVGRKTVSVHTGFEQTGEYSVSFDEQDNMVLNPTSGSPVKLGFRGAINKALQFIEAKTNKDGSISSLTFRVAIPGENGVMPEMTISDKSGFSSEELLDMAVDMRAREVGEVSNEEFNQALNDVFINIEGNPVSNQAPSIETPVEAAKKSSKEKTGEPISSDESVTPSEQVQDHSGVSAAEYDATGRSALDKSIVSRATAALKSLRSIFPDMNIIIHDTDESYAAVNDSPDSAGSFIYEFEDGKVVGDIHINLNKATLLTVAHEVGHAVLLKTFSENPQLFASFVSKMSPILKGMKIGTTDGDISIDEAIRQLTDSGYYSEGEKAEEYLAELTGIMSHLSASNMSDRNILQRIGDLVKEIVSRITGGKIKAISETSNAKEVLDFFKNVSDKIAKGEDIKIDGASNVIQPSGTEGEVTRNSIASKNPVSLQNAIKIANASSFENKLQFKKALQDLIPKTISNLKAIYGKGFNPANKNESTKRYLVDSLVKEGIDAINAHPEAIGWYEEKTQKALDTVAILHPEIKTDMGARSRFIYALAVTSNGNKVDKNFEYAESQYEFFKKNGRFDDAAEMGLQQDSIKPSLRLYNALIAEGVSEVDIATFMKTKFQARELVYVGADGKNKKIATSELADTMVFGAQMLGSKIGNGFYMNLWGNFDELTMDRWFIRTMGRLSGTLIETSAEKTAEARDRFKQSIKPATLGPELTKKLKKLLGESYKIKGDDLATIILKKSSKKDFRSEMTSDPLLDEVRKAAINLDKNLTGEKEAPKNGAERAFYRDVISGVREKLKSEYNIDITTADLQAAIWYPEKLLYQSFKEGYDYETEAEKYVADGAPDYFNAAKKLVKSKGISDGQIEKSTRGTDNSGARYSSNSQSNKVENSKVTSVFGAVKIQTAKEKAAAKRKKSKQSSGGIGDHITGTYYEPGLTVNKNGDFVFFHKSNAEKSSILKGINSTKFNSLRTSREEKGLQYGVASYYTKPTDGERMVGGDSYYVVIPRDEVYPIDTDPNNYRDKVSKSIPKNKPFREEYIRKGISEMAKNDRYKMAVGEWGYSRKGNTSEVPEFRADALVTLKPKPVSGKEGFKTGSDIGINIAHPEAENLITKEVLSDLASDIVNAKSEKGKFDEAYSIANSYQMYGGIVENFGQEDEHVRDITPEEFDIMVAKAPKKLQSKIDAARNIITKNAVGGVGGSLSERRATTYRDKLLGLLPGQSAKKLRDEIYSSPRAFYTKQTWETIASDIDTMTEDELVDRMDISDPQKLFDTLVRAEGPVAPLAFMKYLELKNTQKQDAITRGDTVLADQIEEEIKNAYLSLSNLGTIAGQLLSMYRVLKSKGSDADFYTEMIRKMIESHGGMLDDNQIANVHKAVTEALSARNMYSVMFDDAIAGNATASDLEFFKSEMIKSSMKLTMYVNTLSQDKLRDIISTSIKGHLLSLRSVMMGVNMNMLNMGNAAVERSLQTAVIKALDVISKLTGGAGVSDAVKTGYSTLSYRLSKIAADPSKYVKDTMSDIANYFRNIGTSDNMWKGAIDLMHYGDYDNNEKLFNTKRGFHPIQSLSRLFNNDKPVFGDSGSMVIDLNQSYSLNDFSKWLNKSANMSSEDFNKLSADDKKALRDLFFDEVKSKQIVVNNNLTDFMKSAGTVAELNFRLVALSDYLPRRIVNEVTMQGLADKMGLSDEQAKIFKADPEGYIKKVATVLSPEVLKYWMDNSAEVTMMKDTVMGNSSVAVVNLLKNLPTIIADKIGVQRNTTTERLTDISSLMVDVNMPFVKLPMNAISYTLDYAFWPKSLAKAFLWMSQASKMSGPNRDQAILSSTKYITRAMMGYAFQKMAIHMATVPGLLLLGSPQDDDDEEKLMAKVFPRGSMNVSAFIRMAKGEDTRYQDGDKYWSLFTMGVPGLMFYSYGSAMKGNREKYNKAVTTAFANMNPDDAKKLSKYRGLTDGNLNISDSFSLMSSTIGYYTDQAWFVSLAKLADIATSGGDDHERAVAEYMNSTSKTLATTSVLFSAYAQQMSDVYRESTGAPTPESNFYKIQDYDQDIFSTRMYRTLANQNALIDKFFVDNPYDQQYLQHGMFGEYVSPVKGASVGALSDVLSVMTPTRAVYGNWDRTQQLYYNIYSTASTSKIRGYQATLTEPYIGMVEEATLPAKNLLEPAETIKIQIPANYYNLINAKSGAARKELAAMLSEKWSGSTVGGLPYMPEDLNNPAKNGNKEIADIRKGLTVSFSEANKIVNKFIKPWSLLKSDDMIPFLGMPNAEKIQKLKSMVEASVITYETYDPNKGFTVPSYKFITSSSINEKLKELSDISISMYVSQLEKAMSFEDKYKMTLNVE